MVDGWGSGEECGGGSRDAGVLDRLVSRKGPGLAFARVTSISHGAQHPLDEHR